MKIKIAVTDACIFIDLIDLEIINLLFKLDFDIHTTSAVFYELYPEQQEILKKHQTDKNLTNHNLKQGDLVEISETSYPKSL